MSRLNILAVVWLFSIQCAQSIVVLIYHTLFVFLHKVYFILYIQPNYIALYYCISI